MFRFLLLFGLLGGVTAIYDHRPAERFQTLLPLLSPAQLQQLKPIIYDQCRTKGQILAAAKDWLRDQPPRTQYNFIRSQLDYKRKDEARNLALDAMEEHVSPEARSLNREIRRIYDDMNISDRQTCEGVSATIRRADGRLREELGIDPMNCAGIFASLGA